MTEQSPVDQYAVQPFTAADMAVLDAVDHARVVDDLDYTGLFDYDEADL